MSYYLAEGIEVMNNKYKSRTDSASYSDPDDVMSPEEEAEADDLRERQIAGFFDNFDKLAFDKRMEVIGEIKDELDSTYSITADIALSISNSEYQGMGIIDGYRYSAKEYAIGCIENNNIFWNYDR